ncbi:MAG: putative NADH-flavin reductase [Candidatus Saccharibacteria bacterium]|nr:putative NADH-flavin reductase [Candidatus Saccharibacteria bacterium]
MNIAIIAANGRLGCELVKVALEAGHTVRAGTRGLSHFKDTPHLTAIPCDATNYYEVKALIKDQDVVFSCIGHVPNSLPNVQTLATKIIIRAMKEVGIKRFVTLTGTGVRQPGDHITLIDRFLNLGIEILDKQRVTDGRNHVKVLQKSDLNWTVIRVLKLQFKNNRPFTLRTHGPTLPFVSREEAARAMLDVAEKNTFIRELPIIGR